MKVLKVYPHNQPLTNAPIWIDFTGRVITTKDITENDLIYCDYGFDVLEIISNKNGPTGRMNWDQMREFYIDVIDEMETAKEDFSVIDKILEFY